MSNDILVVVSTWNRKTLTGISLDSLRRNISPCSDVLILDDASTEYTETWLKRWGWPVIRRRDPAGVGEAAKGRIAEFMRRKDYAYLCTLDNDLLYSHYFDYRLLCLLQQARKSNLHNQLTVFSGYRSCTQTIVRETPFWLEAATVNGACQFMDRRTAEIVFKAFNELYPVWPHNWDGEFSKFFSRIVIPRRSYIQHLGIYGDGVNGESTDTAIDFVGEFVL